MSAGVHATADALLLQSPFGVNLVQLCEYLLRKIRQERVVSEEQLARLEGLGSGDARLGALVRSYLTLNRVMTVPGGLQPLDAVSQILVDAVSDTPVAIIGTDLMAYPKSYATLAMTEHVSFWAIRKWVTETRVNQIRAWIATYPGPGQPCREMSDLEALPAWLEDLPFDDIERGYQFANAVRCEAILGEQMKLADLSSGDYVPDVLKRLAEVTEIKPEILKDCYPYAWCLALDKIATDVIPGGQ